MKYRGPGTRLNVGTKINVTPLPILTKLSGRKKKHRKTKINAITKGIQSVLQTAKKQTNKKLTKYQFNNKRCLEYTPNT